MRRDGHAQGFRRHYCDDAAGSGAEPAFRCAVRFHPAAVDRPSPVRALPAHLPREEQRIEPEQGNCTCPDCGGALRPGASAREGDCPGQGDLRHAGPCRRLQVRPSSAAVPSGRDHGCAGHRDRPIDAGRLGRPGICLARSDHQPHPRGRADSLEDPYRRYAGPHARSGTWQDGNRQALGLCGR